MNKGRLWGLVGLFIGTVAWAGDTPLTTVRVASGLNRPVYVEHAPGDFERLFIVEQRGVIRILDLDTLEVHATPFLDIDALIAGGTGSFDERGLLGLAFHPNYESNGFFYVNYTDASSDTVIARYSVSDDPDVADPTSAQVVLTADQPFTNHNGGWIGFGPNDGYLYIALGDGGSFCDPNVRAQDITNQRLGKILRIDVDVPGAGFAIPPDNPFVGLDGDDEIWAYGLRNPYRCGFDRETGDFYIGDVGQDAREEVNFQPADSPGGENYGWDCEEGSGCTVGCPPPVGCTCGDMTLTHPIHSYATGANCSVIGGRVYRGCAIPDLQGVYFFGDYCGDQIWSFRVEGGAQTDFTLRTIELAPGGTEFIRDIAAIGEDAAGEIYIVDRGTATTGEIFKIVPDAPPVEDCNGNGQEDACDLLRGVSLDVDRDGVPDECALPDFLRGDADGDGNFNGLPDSLFILAHQFQGGPPPPCREAADADADGVFNGLNDGLYVLSAQFSGGPPPASPYPDCGSDPDPIATLGCESHPGCL